MQLSRSLGARLLAIYLPLVTLTLIMVFAVLEYQFYQNKRQELTVTLNELVSVQKTSIATAAWEVDIDEITRLLQATVELSYVGSAVFQDSMGDITAQVGDTQTEPESPEFRAKERVLFKDGDNEEFLGFLEITVHTDAIRQELLSHIADQTVVLLVLIFVLSIGTFYTSKILISAPLDQLKQAMQTSISDETLKPLSWSRKDELGDVVNAYNNMQAHRARAEEEVTHYQSHLEEIVEERTRQLESKTVLLEAVLGSINQGLVAYDKDLMLIISNERFKSIRDVPDELAKPGASFVDWVKLDVERGEFGVGNPTRPDGKILEIEGGPLPTGGFVSTFTDISARKAAEKNLQDAYGIISESINYASKIQRSVLPDETLFSAHLKDHFILWEPRDVVGGDIYWSFPWGDGLLILLGDCTGHGVPGAFMTLIASGALDKAISEVPLGNVSSLMQRMHQLIQERLGQNSEEGESDDGLDLGICYLLPQKDQLTFVGARLELFILENDEVSLIKGTKRSIGYRGVSPTQEYECHHIQGLANKAFYMSSDGLIDQIGGPKNIMFGKRRFKEVLLKTQNIPMKDQRSALIKAMHEYQGDQRRRDDVSILGFKL